MHLYLIYLAAPFQALLDAPQLCYQIYINFTNLPFQKAHKDKKDKTLSSILAFLPPKQKT